MRILDKAEVNKRGCDYCGEMIHHKFNNRTKPYSMAYDECPHECCIFPETNNYKCFVAETTISIQQASMIAEAQAVAAKRRETNKWIK